MRPAASRLALAQGILALALGVSLFELAAFVERRTGMGALPSAFLEEAGKAALILGFGLFGLRSERARRAALLSGARGLCLGLVGVAIFVAAENLAYFLAFPEASVLERLVWTLPVHIVAALLEAIGALVLLRALAPLPKGRKVEPGELALGIVAFGLALLGAAAWHWAANLLVLAGLSTRNLVLGALTGSGLAVLLFTLLLRRAFIGGFLDGTD